MVWCFQLFKENVDRYDVIAIHLHAYHLAESRVATNEKIRN